MKDEKDENEKDEMKIAVLVSGSGTNLQAIIDSIESGYLHEVSIECVISDNPQAYAIERARKKNIPTYIVEYGKGKEKAETEIIQILEKHKVELIAMAGFMRILSPSFIKRYKMRIMNIHPAILPAFAGMEAQKRAAEYNVKISGCSVHFADEGVDTGPVVVQAAVPAYPDDTEETLRERILKWEHKIYPFAIKMYAQGRIKVDGRKVYVKDAEYESGVITNPKLE